MDSNDRKNMPTADTRTGKVKIPTGWQTLSLTALNEASNPSERWEAAMQLAKHVMDAANG